jgi:hypothetical protein
MRHCRVIGVSPTIPHSKNPHPDPLPSDGRGKNGSRLGVRFRPQSAWSIVSDGGPSN